MIPEAAVEAAAKAMQAKDAHEGFGDYPLWEYKEDATAILEAAVPHMSSPNAASVWDEAVTALYMGNAINQDHMKAMWSHNPYRPTA